MFPSKTSRPVRPSEPFVCISMCERKRGPDSNRRAHIPIVYTGSMFLSLSLSLSLFALRTLLHTDGPLESMSVGSLSAAGDITTLYAHPRCFHFFTGWLFLPTLVREGRQLEVFVPRAPSRDVFLLVGGGHSKERKAELDGRVFILFA